jgi:hypothetical protein
VDSYMKKVCCLRRTIRLKELYVPSAKIRRLGSFFGKMWTNLENLYFMDMMMIGAFFRYYSPKYNYPRFDALSSNYSVYSKL